MTEDPLRADDPRQVGVYRLHARLGEGGMGTVYLAHDPMGHRVAVKVLRPELSSDHEFRARFRSEVSRAREVPPFCTAEVLDADPDHETPYLVAEYVDGPSLADVVRQRGPLAGGALHSVAIGVATALAAIHSADVVHRDLKPANVLLALGMPKVIDFGIAKALEATSEHTVPGQLLGTIAYMAPERFDAGKARRVGPAADVFAWGVLVAFAATGRTPFATDSPTGTAECIVTQPPDLTGLTGPLRDLVARAVEKNPEQRPSAQELVDLLLTAGSLGNRAMQDSLERRPDLRRAAEAMRHTPTYRGRHGVDTDPPTIKPAGATMVNGPSRRTGWARYRVVALVAVLAVVGGFGLSPVRGIVASVFDREQDLSSPSAADTAVLDPFDRTNGWRASRGHTRGGCTVDGSLVVTRRPAGTLQCTGLNRIFTDQLIIVQLRLETPSVCAAVWFDFVVDTGYLVSVCPDRVALGIDYDGDIQRVTSAELESVPLRRWRHVEIQMKESILRIKVDGTPRITRGLDSFGVARGKVVLGLVHDDSTGTVADEGRVAFANLEVRAL